MLVVVFLSTAMLPVHGLWFVGLLLVLAFSGWTGFMVARIAGRHELAHAAVAGVVFLAFSVWLYPGSDFRDVMPGAGPSSMIPPTPAWHDAVVYGLIAFILPAALAGGYVARATSSNTQPRFLSRLTYGAMAVWGITETLDSVPSLFGTYFVGAAGLVPPLALLLAIVTSIGLAACSPGRHRRRVGAWYCLFVLVGLATSFGTVPRLIAEIAAAAMPSLWFVRSAKDAPSPEQGT